MLFSAPSDDRDPMNYRDKIIDRQIGRNAELFALAVGEKATREERYPLVRILVSILEQARPEWNQSPNKDRQIAHIVFKMSKGAIPLDETAEIVRLRDMERGFVPLPERPGDTDAERASYSEAAEAPGADVSGAHAPDEGAAAPDAETTRPEALAEVPVRPPQVDLFAERGGSSSDAV